MQRIRWALFLVSLLVPIVSHAQKTEVAATIGAALSPDGKGPVLCINPAMCPIGPVTTGSVPLGAGVSWQTSFAYRLANLKATALYFELPLAGSPSRSGPGTFSGFSSVFFTPSAHVKFLPGGSVSPFASVGGGVAHFSSIDSRGNAGALQLGGGVDFRTPLKALGIRAEVRDFITGHSSVAPLGFFTTHVQSIFAGGGVVLKF
ncbi:MAG TPA: hypothetical protein VF532_23005 [Candidatus Angelobacter sp.]